eukprot:1154423-Pelagomonas_calceolata.AAC.1
MGLEGSGSTRLQSYTFNVSVIHISTSCTCKVPNGSSSRGVTGGKAVQSRRRRVYARRRMADSTRLTLISSTKWAWSLQAHRPEKWSGKLEEGRKVPLKLLANFK